MVISRRWFPLFLAVAVVGTVIVSCGSGKGTASEVSLAALEKSPEQWKGKRVEIKGELKRFTDPDGRSYGVIEDAAQNRIGLKSLASWQQFIDKPVAAEGTVEFDASFGWFLANPTIRASPP